MENNYTYVQEESAQNGSILRGLIGAVVGAIVGALLWAVVSIATERIFSIIGFAVGFVVGYGYDLLKGRKGAARIVIVLLCVILSVIIGTAGAYTWWLHDAFVEESEFIATASKEELLQTYLTPEELAVYNSYPPVLKQRTQASFEVTMPTETEYFQLTLADPEFQQALGGECLSSIFFALLGSLALILNNGKTRKQQVTEAHPVNFDEAAIDTADIAPEEPADVVNALATEESKDDSDALTL